MSDKRSWFLVAVMMTLIVITGTASEANAAGRIICWKDENGKVVGCGDRVPPEYRENATKELDSRGITRKTTATPEEIERRRAEAREMERKRAEERKRLDEEQRQDRALLATYANEQEIDHRRDRELEQIEAQIRQLDVSLKNVNERRADLEKRRDVAQNDKYLQAALPELTSELEKVSAQRRRLEEQMASQEKIKNTIRARYAEQKQRFRTLKNGSTTPATSSSSY